MELRMVPAARRRWRRAGKRERQDHRQDESRISPHQGFSEWETGALSYGSGFNPSGVGWLRWALGKFSRAIPGESGRGQEERSRYRIEAGMAAVFIGYHHRPGETALECDRAE